MNILSFNSCGLGLEKCKAISKLCKRHNISFLGIQETRLSLINSFKAKSVWGNFHFEYVVSSSIGRSGVLVSIWDPNSFHKTNVISKENLLIIEGVWAMNQLHCYMFNIYAPEDDRKKEALWQSILEFMSYNPGHYIIFGDFNAVRNESERIGSLFNSSSASVFTHFIQEGRLWDVPLGGHSFTRINGRGDKLSKLDRFLITEDSSPYFQNFSALVLDSPISDHRPIILKPSTLDFGPTPFKFYNSWLLDNRLHDLVSHFWKHRMAEVGSNPISDFKNKMKALKPIITEWSKNLNASNLSEKNDLLRKIKESDDNIEMGIGGPSADSHRVSWLEKLRLSSLKKIWMLHRKLKLNGVSKWMKTRNFSMQLLIRNAKLLLSMGLCSMVTGLQVLFRSKMFSSISLNPNFNELRWLKSIPAALFTNLFVLIRTYFLVLWLLKRKFEMLFGIVGQKKRQARTDILLGPVWFVDGFRNRYRYE
ncbi:RNA-directed DNA polymerase, eukaryota, reverse transcriptase zinc-binding domain protein [Tanacetum coccineum]